MFILVDVVLLTISSQSTLVMAITFSSLKGDVPLTIDLGDP